jgi:hypothetical protein
MYRSAIIAFFTILATLSFASCGRGERVTLPATTPLPSATIIATTTLTPSAVSHPSSTPYSDEIEKMGLAYSNWVSPFRQALSMEFLLRFPESKYRDRVLWDFVGQEPWRKIPVNSASRQDVLTGLMENGLNSGKMSLDTLTSWLEEHDYEVKDQRQVQNLFGNGQIALLLWLRHNPSNRDFPQFEGETFYAVERDQNHSFIVSLIYPWTFTWNTILNLISTDDINGDGVSEIVIEEAFWRSGSTSGICDTNLSVLRWDKTVGAFTNIAGQINQIDGFTEL